MRQKLFGEKHLLVAEVSYWLGNICYESFRFDQAFESLKKAYLAYRDFQAFEKRTTQAQTLLMTLVPQS